MKRVIVAVVGIGCGLCVSCTHIAAVKGGNGVRDALSVEAVGTGDLSELILPAGSVVQERTVNEAMLVFSDWYNRMVSPEERTFSFLIESLSQADMGRKRTVDVSGMPMDQALQKMTDSFGMAVHCINGLYRIRPIEAATRGVAASETGSLQETSYLGDFLTSHIVAAVVGYEFARKTPNGANIPVFLPEPVEGECNGILFKIIAPAQFAEKFFWLYNDSHDEWTQPSILYRSDMLYSFCCTQGDSGFGHLSTNDFFPIPTQNRFSSTIWAQGQPFILSPDDASVAEGQIRQHFDVLTNQLAQSEARLRLLREGTPEYISERYACADDVTGIRKLQEKRQRLAESVEQLEVNKKFLRILFPD